ncbi:MAG: hypothetical protein HUU35_12030 [Armatimonadetes bacterium]|nr:hypothetical protein [Armatimonadota bacterium]
MVGLHGVAEKGIAEQLQKSAPAENWEVDLALLAPTKLLLGQAADVKGHGVKAKLDEGMVANDVTFELLGLQLDRQSGQMKIKDAQAANFGLVLDQETLAAAIRHETVSAKALKDVKVTIDQGKLTIAMAMDALGSTIKTTIKGRPKVVPPATFAVVIDDVSVQLPRSELLAGAKEQMERGMKQALGKDFRYDFSDGGRTPVTLKSVTAQPGALVVSGSLDPKMLRE